MRPNRGRSGFSASRCEGRPIPWRSPMDSVVICWMVVVYLLLLLFLRRAKFSYQDLRKL